MLACICGGWIELLILLCGCGITGWITSIYNKCKKPCCTKSGEILYIPPNEERNIIW